MGARCSVAFDQFPGLFDPTVSANPVREAFEVAVHPRNLDIVPRGDLIEVVDTQRVAELFQLWAHAFDPLEVVRTGLARRVEHGRMAAPHGLIPTDLSRSKTDLRARKVFRCGRANQSEVRKMAA